MDTSTATTRYVCDSALDLLMMEAVSLFSLPSSLPLGAGAADPASVEQDREAAYFKLEQLGHRVGMGLVERATRDRPRFTDTLDVIKFICKDYWLLLFNKQIDNLKTNHRGVYVLTDTNFKWFARMSADVASETSQLAFAHAAFPCGLIRGALAGLGLQTVVLAEVGNIPQCTFQIKLRT
ncbi:NO signaling/Golgi transport ligand-binding domain-containing protein [Chytriomyces sp. MP71]|nr:NO signaling/Golgi transport ligand-binding domain-containing protein [Chytriomyces sp. MP71]